ncbi:MAG: hypothetical protein IPN34_11580 [Planctomycetes bacterium]|nr:hypothetical protein [Planctomycetota bacterium]
MSRRPSLVFLALLAGLLAQGAALLWLFTVPGAPSSSAGPHPRFPVLRVAPRAFEAAEPLRAPTLLYGVGAFLALFALLALGLGGGRPLRAGRGAFAGATLGVAGSALALWVAYLGAPRATDGWAGLPPGSAWLLFGLWPAEALFAWVYVRHFHELVWPPSAERRFAALLAERDRACGERER